MVKPAIDVMSSIGQVSKKLGVSAHTLRYYEKIGLLPQVSKDAGGRRNYRTVDIDKIRFIQRAKRMQFTLDEIKQLLNLDLLPAVPKRDAQALVRTKLSDIDENLSELTRLKQDLSAMLEQCIASESDDDCPIIEGIRDK